MRKNWRNNIAILFALTALLFSCSKQEESREIYTCPMHPTVIADKPGACPVCGMDLVRKATAGEDVKITEDLAKLIKSPNEVVASKINTIKAVYKSMNTTTEALGIVTYDSRNTYTIPARTAGRLEKVYLKYPFQRVAKGQKVAEIYSPELITAQREFLFLLENDPGNTDLIEGSKSKLQLLGFSSAQITELTKRKDPSITVSIFSPYDGYVVTDDQPAPQLSPATSSSAKMNAMASSGTVNPTQSTAGELTRVGSYVSQGQTIFKIVNTSSLFVDLSLPVSQAGAVKPNGEILLDLGTGSSEKEKIDLVLPFFELGEEFVRIRVYVKHAENIQIGQLVKAALPFHSGEALWLPKEAIVDLGMDHVVFVKDRNTFKAKKVVTGMRADGSIEIKSGLASMDDVASNAQYLVDSESFIKSK